MIFVRIERFFAARMRRYAMRSGLSLIYEFEFPNNINIYPIISIIHLKLAPKNSDPYNCPRNDYLISVKIYKIISKKITEIRNREIYGSPLKTIRSRQENY
jgi:hypothetical protein